MIRTHRKRIALILSFVIDVPDSGGVPLVAAAPRHIVRTEGRS